MQILSILFWNAYNDKKNSLIFGLSSTKDVAQSWMNSGHSQSIQLGKVKSPLMTVQLIISARYFWYMIIYNPLKSP